MGTDARVAHCLVTTRGRGSLQGPRGGRRLGDDGGPLLGHDGMMVARRERRGALVRGAMARAKKKKRVSDSGDSGPTPPPPAQVLRFWRR